MFIPDIVLLQLFSGFILAIKTLNVKAGLIQSVARRELSVELAVG